EWIVADYRRCAFALEVKAPKPQELIAGELQSWSPSTGKIKLRYTPKTMRDWQKEAGAPAVWVHPAAFKGEYQITIRGELELKQNLVLLFDVAGDTRGIAVFGGARGTASTPGAPNKAA